MSLGKLQRLFAPRSVAVIGATSRANSAGRLVMSGLMNGGFAGPVMPVNAKEKAVLGVLAYSHILELPLTPDLAIVCSESEQAKAELALLGQLGCKVVVLCSRLDERDKAEVQELLQRFDFRLLGPDSIGLMIPAIGLHASLAHCPAKPGKIAFVSQSAAVCTTVLDWANYNQIGFSSFISLGEALDITFGELLDYLGRDGKTQAIMLYVDSIQDKQRFMSAARAASRNKPILVIKSGRSQQGAQAAALHSGGEVGLDAVFDAAFRRAGMLRVKDLHELFAAVETLAYSKPVKGERLAIISNGGGPGVLALDTLLENGGKLAELSADTLAKLDAILPTGWSGQNPVDMLGDADPKRYTQCLDVLLESGDADAVLVMHAPALFACGEDSAQAVIDSFTRHRASGRCNLLTNWMGEHSAYAARERLRNAGIPTYRTPEAAVGAFMHMVEFRRNQKLLQHTPQTVSELIPADAALQRQELQGYLNKGRQVLETHTASALLQAYGINTIDTWLVKNKAEALSQAERIGYPVALKIQSPDILHKADVHGVSLNLNNAQELEIAADSMLERVHQAYPEAQVDGMLLQRMALSAGAQELRIAVICDPVFGPAIFLGEGGSEWDEAKDAAVALPPLNMALSRYLLISAIKMQKIRERNLPQSMDMQAVCALLTRISHLVIDCAEIYRLDLNPVLVAGDQVTVLDANIQLRANDQSTQQRLAIRPYPKELEQRCNLKSGLEVLLRPILPEDEPRHLAFDSSLSDEDRYKRYFGARGQMTHEEMALLTQIDYAREMAFIAEDRQAPDDRAILGVVRATIDPDNIEAEFAMVVRSDMQGQGLGSRLLSKLIDYYRAKGTERVSGITMIQNRGMAGLAKKLGFKVRMDLEEGVIEMNLQLVE
ncbi:bifunctional acetate--CoA ligase family protein/GNAT family N-acetyltransferase [Aliagarivorans marinus]|uniref:bifunctional acetate--CoA ligase family protein/GNAT family N-acetyltransferase n=1 Tax=Aliagarivorans marinus TaxID=561965 RepID=UPI00041E2E88|nr:bifunctional acetate--CoA ligase family protein/GNAT family N-acetyltransferase [Aliagarivorans marinus]